MLVEDRLDDVAGVLAAQSFPVTGHVVVRTDASTDRAEVLRVVAAAAEAPAGPGGPAGGARRWLTVLPNAGRRPVTSQ